MNILWFYGIVAPTDPLEHYKLIIINSIPKMLHLRQGTALIPEDVPVEMDGDP